MKSLLILIILFEASSVWARLSGGLEVRNRTFRMIADQVKARKAEEALKKKQQAVLDTVLLEKINR